jgi:hypothetical protein
MGRPRRAQFLYLRVLTALPWAASGLRGGNGRGNRPDWVSGSNTRSIPSEADENCGTVTEVEPAQTLKETIRRERHGQAPRNPSQRFFFETKNTPEPHRPVPVEHLSPSNTQTTSSGPLQRLPGRGLCRYVAEARRRTSSETRSPNAWRLKTAKKRGTRRLASNRGAQERKVTGFQGSGRRKIALDPGIAKFRMLRGECEGGPCRFGTRFPWRRIRIAGRPARGRPDP